MNQKIRIADLAPSQSPARGNIVPAMEGGNTVYMTIAQLLALIMSDDGALAEKQPRSERLTAVADLENPAEELLYFTEAGVPSLARVSGLALDILASDEANEALDALGASALGAALFKATAAVAARAALGAGAIGELLYTAETAAAGRAALSAPAMPTSTTGTAGHWARILVEASPAVLPSGGTWAYFLLGWHSTDGNLSTSSTAAGVAAGGTQILAAVANRTYGGVAWRVNG